MKVCFFFSYSEAPEDADFCSKGARPSASHFQTNDYTVGPYLICGRNGLFCALISRRAGRLGHVANLRRAVFGCLCVERPGREPDISLRFTHYGSGSQQQAGIGLLSSCVERRGKHRSWSFVSVREGGSAGKEEDRRGQRWTSAT